MYLSDVRTKEQDGKRKTPAIENPKRCKHNAVLIKTGSATRPAALAIMLSRGVHCYGDAANSELNQYVRKGLGSINGHAQSIGQVPPNMRTGDIQVRRVIS